MHDFKGSFFMKSVRDYKKLTINPMAMKIETELTWDVAMSRLCSVLETIDF